MGLLLSDNTCALFRNIFLKLYLKQYLGSPLNMMASKNHIDIHLANLYFSCSWTHYNMAEPYCNHYGKRFFQSMIANRHWWSTTLIIRHNNDSYTHTHFQTTLVHSLKAVCARHNVADCSFILLITWKLMDNHTEPIFWCMKEV